ncbi:MAG: hypothetical protein J5827_00185 [Oscillospiraceae bacterium]|nr:hypothetical protein [Oscillospiraceae bacterium]
MKKLSNLKKSKTLYLVVSILASVLLWMYVVNYENKDVNNTVTGIEVEFTGIDGILADRQLVVTGVSTGSVDLTLLGKRSVVAPISRGDVRITVDLTDIRSAGEYDRVYNVEFTGVGKGAEDIFIISKSPEYITVKVDQTAKKPVEIRGDFDGSVADGYMLEQIEYEPETVEVSGPAELVSQIRYAHVVVQRENLTRSVTGIVSFTLTDENGSEVTGDGLTTDVQAVKYTVPVVMVKDVVLGVDIIPGGGAGEENAFVEIDPPVITLTGSADILNSINRISLGSVDLSEFATAFGKTFTIPLPNDVHNLSGETEAEVEVTLKGLETKRIIATNIELNNISEGYSADTITQYKEVLIRGTEESLEDINADDVVIVVDLAGIGQAVGRYSLPGKVYVDSEENVGAVGGNYTVVVEITKDE